MPVALSQTMNVSLIYLLYILKLLMVLRHDLRSSLTRNTSTRKGPSGYPIATPSFCR